MTKLNWKLILGIPLFLAPLIVVGNEFYNATGAPATGSGLSSSTMRAEFAAAEDGFDLLPTLSGNGDKIVVINAGGTSLTSIPFITVAAGGTGATTLTDGGVLLGSGTGAITPMAVLADGEIIVGDGTGDPVPESGATARTSLGLAIGTNVQAFGALLDDLNTLGANSADSEFMVGTGAGALAWESGATARTSMGVTIGANVQAFGAVLDDLNTLGAASSDSKIIVATGAGAFAYESGATARTSLGVAIDSDVQADLAVPSQAEAEAGSATTERVWTAQRVSQAIAAISPANTLEWTAKTGAYTLAAGDFGDMIEVTSGTFTMAFTAAATLGVDWRVYVANRGTGEVRLDPNSSELVDGLSTYIMYPGEIRLIHCTGTAFQSVVLHSFEVTYTAGGTFTTPPGYLRFGGILWGAGASGARGTYSGGGGGGAAVPFNMLASRFGTTETITIAAGGAAQTSATSNGNGGGNSTLGSLLTSYGGGAGTHDVMESRAPGGGGGGALSAGALTTGGNPMGHFSSSPDGFGGASGYGRFVGINDNSYGGAGGGNNRNIGGGSNVYGGAGGGASNSIKNAGGTSVFGGDGGAGSSDRNGTAGTQPGGGGGGTGTGASSGAGADGQLDIWGVM